MAADESPKQGEAHANYENDSKKKRSALSRQPKSDHEGSSDDETSIDDDEGSQRQNGNGRFLTEIEKKRNHLNSEKKRRNQIRKGFSELIRESQQAPNSYLHQAQLMHDIYNALTSVQLIPGAAESRRSESDLLNMAIQHVDDLVQQKADLESRVQYLRKLTAGVIGAALTVVGISVTALLAFLIANPPSRLKFDLSTTERESLRQLPPLRKLYGHILQERQSANQSERAAGHRNVPNGEGFEKPLRKLASKITAEFLVPWYGELSEEKKFLQSVQDKVVISVGALLRRILTVDWARYISDELLPAITEHVAETKRAERRLLSSSVLNRQRLEAHTLENRNLERFYRGGNLHPVVTRFGNRTEAECFHLRGSLAKILHVVMPEAERQSALVISLVREIIVCKILQPLLEKITEPDFWNQTIISLSESPLLQRGEIIGIQESLLRFEERSKINLNIRLHDQSLLKFQTFEEFLDFIKDCEDLIEAELIQSNIETELAAQKKLVAEMEGQPSNTKNAFRDNLAGVRVYVNRLEVAEKRIERKIEKLRKIGKLGLRGDDGNFASLVDLYRNKQAFALFEKFLDLENKTVFIHVWQILTQANLPLDVNEDVDEVQWTAFAQVMEVLSDGARDLIGIDPSRWNEIVLLWSEHQRRGLVFRQLDPLTASVVEAAEKSAWDDRRRDILEFFVSLNRELTYILEQEDMPTFFRSPAWFQYGQEGLSDTCAVSRSYKEFLVLHRELRRRFPSTMMFRTVPEISVFSELLKSKHEIAGARRALLQNYLDELLLVPAIRTTSEDLAVFLLGKQSADTMFRERKAAKRLGKTVASNTTSLSKEQSPLPHSTTPMARGPAVGLFSLIVEVFDLNGSGNWFRKQAVAILLQQVFGEMIDRYFNIRLKEHTNEKNLSGVLDRALESFWPQGRKLSGDSSQPERTTMQKELARSEAWVRLKSKMTALLSTLLGESNVIGGAESLFSSFQNREINTHIVYTELDRLLAKF
ncbi:Intermediate filament protein [Gonapodya sp. JEL0774]|nr:Intermediate filament protein [Gonapodya sp. JEL0774]